MKRIIALSSVAAMLITVQSCNVNTAGQEQKASVEMNPNDSLFQVNDGGYSFAIILPKDLMINHSPNIKVNTATGELHIQVGEQFWIVASQEKSDISVIKSIMNDDMLFTNRIVEENTTSIMYQRILPDGSEYDYSYCNFSEVGGKQYVFKTCEEGEFSMDSVTRMKEAICSVRASV